MDKLRVIQLFIRLADLGSFTMVAEQANALIALGITELSTMFADFMWAYPDIESDIYLGVSETMQ